MNPPVHRVLCVLALTSCPAFSAIGFQKQDCAVYGNLIEQSPSAHVYENNYVHYTINFDNQGVAEELEVKFDKGKKPSFQLMLSCMPNPICKDDLKWGERKVSPNGKTISLTSQNHRYKATISKEQWNRPAKISITKLR